MSRNLEFASYPPNKNISKLPPLDSPWFSHGDEKSPHHSKRLGLGSHVAGVMVEADSRCAAVLVQDLFAEATARRVVLGDHIIRGRLATKLRASQGARRAWPKGFVE